MTVPYPNGDDRDPPPGPPGAQENTPHIRERVAKIEAELKHLTTREDTQALKTEIQNVRTVIAELGGEIKGLVKDVESEVKDLKSWALLKIITVISLVGILITAIVSALAYLSK